MNSRARCCSDEAGEKTADTRPLEMPETPERSDGVEFVSPGMSMLSDEGLDSVDTAGVALVGLEHGNMRSSSTT